MDGHQSIYSDLYTHYVWISNVGWTTINHISCFDTYVTQDVGTCGNDIDTWWLARNNQCFWVSHAFSPSSSISVNYHNLESIESIGSIESIESMNLLAQESIFESGEVLWFRQDFDMRWLVVCPTCKNFSFVHAAWVLYIHNYQASTKEIWWDDPQVSLPCPGFFTADTSTLSQSQMSSDCQNSNLSANDDSKELRHENECVWKSGYYQNGISTGENDEKPVI